jgi:hypothetical protein
MDKFFPVFCSFGFCFKMFCLGIITKMLENVYFYVIPLLVSERPEVQNSLCTISFETEKGGLGSQEKNRNVQKRKEIVKSHLCAGLYFYYWILCASKVETQLTSNWFKSCNESRLFWDSLYLYLQNIPLGN